MTKARTCKDCAAEGITTKRPAPHPGPRCATHHRAVSDQRRATARERHITTTYGITEAEYAAIYEAQGGSCAICQRAKGTGRKRLSVDHDHETGMVRGLLCSKCNRDVLGHLHDDVDAFLRGAEYLRSPPARGVIGLRIVPVDGAPTKARPAPPRRRRKRRARKSA
ncbi:recombination endonuclease [Rhodococcus phage RGL3]|uniref:Recombination endonuclease n=1 Tax=Rhodococcus phage RGL3 TaxID=2922221 RepID=G9FHN7_9CAUD|nr:endonuclease VII [Rhodococcus phage RGL3]AEV52125.1 recombination endonuclease [Rhodococcus phage RGL3]